MLLEWERREWLEARAIIETMKGSGRGKLRRVGSRWEFRSPEIIAAVISNSGIYTERRIG
jgi:hypothetical protein